MGNPASAFGRKQRGVAIGMALGLVVTIAAFVWPLPPSPAAGPALRAAFGAAAALLVAAWLVIAVARLAAHRFFAPTDIDGAGLTEASARAKMLQAVTQNTLEQAVLAVIGYAAWLGLMPPASAPRIAFCVVLFGLGRLLFFIGYARGAPFRALGFALTFYPTAGLYLLAAPAAFARLAGLLSAS